MLTLHGFPNPNTTLFLRGDLEAEVSENGSAHGTLFIELVLAVVVFEHPARVNATIVRFVEGTQVKVIRCKTCRAAIGVWAVAPDHDETWLIAWLEKLQADDLVPSSVRCRCGKPRRLVFKTKR